MERLHSVTYLCNYFLVGGCGL